MLRSFASLVLALWLAPTGAAAEDAFLAAATPQIEKLIHDELWGHYDVVSVSVLDINDRAGELSSLHPRYGLRTIRASFLAVRNAHWSDGLNREVVERFCEGAAQLFLLCRATGHRFAGTLEVDLAFTVDGWKVLSRHLNSLRSYPLAGYLRCEPVLSDSDVDENQSVLSRCFGRADPLRAGADPDDPRKLAIALTNTGSSPLDTTAVERGCQYEIDGRPAYRNSLIALSCLGGCPELAPGATLRFSFPLEQLHFGPEGRSPVPPGSHQVVVRYPGVAPATTWILFPD